MRVIHILDHSLPVQSDYALRTIAIIREQRAMGWETFHLTGPRQGPSAVTEEQVEGWHFYRTPPPGGILESVPVLSEFELMGEIAFRVEQLARSVRPHVLHAHSPVLNAIPALRVGRRLGVPVVYELRSFWNDASDNGGSPRGALGRRVMQWLETWVLKRADAVTTLSERTRSEVLARGVRPDKVTVVPAMALEDRPAADRAAEMPANGSPRDWKSSVARYADVYARVVHEPSLRT